MLCHLITHWTEVTLSHGDFCVLSYILLTQQNLKLVCCSPPAALSSISNWSFISAQSLILHHHVWLLGFSVWIRCLSTPTVSCHRSGRYTKKCKENQFCFKSTQTLQSPLVSKLLLFVGIFVDWGALQWCWRSVFVCKVLTHDTKHKAVWSGSDSEVGSPDSQLNVIRLIDSCFQMNHRT